LSYLKTYLLLLKPILCTNRAFIQFPIQSRDIFTGMNETLKGKFSPLCLPAPPTLRAEQENLPKAFDFLVAKPLANFLPLWGQAPLAEVRWHFP
jgi:hypothetical protein